MLNDRFWTKVDKTHPSGCWVWTANRNNKGYGLFRPGGTAPKELAHRLSYADAFGPIPQGGLILHSCDNRLCVNPAHLRVGTFKDNVADMDERGRRVSNARRGAANPNTKMTERQIINIRRDYVAGVPIKTILTRYRITKAAMNDYVSGKSWRHILGKPGCPGIKALKAEAAKRQRNSARLSMEDARAIRARLESGERGVDLASEYGVHNATISDIKKNRIWAE